MTAIRRLNRPGRLACGCLVGGAVWFGAMAPPTRVEAQSQPTPLSYTTGQADQGQAAYVEHCASCHGQNLDDGAYGPPLNPLDTIRPVTEAMLTKVADGEWLAWRRTYDAFGFSPLKKINRTTIADLRVAWTWSLPNGPNESTPIVHDGVLFIHSYGDKVQALDAATGDLFWQYSRRLPTGVAPSVKRGISIYGTRLYVPT